MATGIVAETRAYMAMAAVEAAVATRAANASIGLRTVDRVVFEVDMAVHFHMDFADEGRTLVVVPSLVEIARELLDHADADHTEATADFAQCTSLASSLTYWLPPSPQTTDH